MTITTYLIQGYNHNQLAYAEYGISYLDKVVIWLEQLIQEQGYCYLASIGKWYSWYWDIATTIKLYQGHGQN
jgi:hypothetical protein